MGTTKVGEMFFGELISYSYLASECLNISYYQFCTKDQEWQFESELRIFAYTHKISDNVNGTEIIFEPDEERNYRAVLPEPEINKSKVTD